VSKKVKFEVPKADEGARLDQVLARNVPGLSRTKARVLLDIGGVFVDGARVKVAGRKLKAGQVIEANMGGALDRATKKVGKAARERDAEALPDYQVVFEDADIVVVDKPAGLLTAPTPESDRGNLADQLGRRGTGPVKVVHRIDLQTSGLLIFARTDDANRVLSEKFRVHDVGREYLAVVDGVFPDSIERIADPIDGRKALTFVSVERASGDERTLIRCRLETGRTHQIRIHCASVGHPVLGDRRYGRRMSGGPPRMALHATRLAVTHPRTGEQLDFRSELPDDLSQWLDRA
jgi:23S rRNA pseudouridine1911/1915/1917 synthase